MFQRRKDRKPNLKTSISRVFHCSRRKVFVGDKFLTPISQNDMEMFLRHDLTDKRKYVKNVLECNTFALLLRANAKLHFIKRDVINAAVGTVWVDSFNYAPPHAFNFYVDPDICFHFIEPQTDHEIQNPGWKVLLVII